MARALRLEFAGACYHLINRGNYRRNLFAEGGAAEAFERVLGEAAGRFGWRVHAYVVMRNHFHLAVELTEPNLSAGMQWLQGTWIRRYNRFRRLVGRPFQDRFHSLVVEPGHAFGQVCHYIHLNPVRAGAVEAAAVDHYPWSSLPKFPRTDRPAWLDPSTVLTEAGALADAKAGWRSYVQYLEFLATDALARKELVHETMSRGWCVGSRSFRSDVRTEAARRGADLERERYAGLERDVLVQERAQAWEEQLQRLAGLAKIDLEKLPARKSAPEKVLLAAALKRSTSVSNGWLARRLAMGEPASASQFVRRWLLQPARAVEVGRLLSRVKT